MNEIYVDLQNTYTFDISKMSPYFMLLTILVIRFNNKPAFEYPHLFVIEEFLLGHRKQMDNHKTIHYHSKINKEKNTNKFNFICDK